MFANTTEGKLMEYLLGKLILLLINIILKTILYILESYQFKLYKSEYPMDLN